MSVTRKMQAIYRKVPPVADCKGLCHDACGSLIVTPMEARAMEHARVRNYSVDRVSCVHLNQARRCSIYDARPLICRLYGATDDLKCTHGCTPTLTKDAAHDLIKNSRRIGGALVRIDPAPLT